MKKILLSIFCLLSLVSVYGQEEYENVNVPNLKWGYNSNVQYYSNSLKSLSFWNFHAPTKDDKRNKVWRKETISMSINRPCVQSETMSFTIHNQNNAHDKIYTVLDAKGKNKFYADNVYWGFYITVNKKTGGTESFKIHFSDNKYRNSAYTYRDYWSNLTNDWLPCPYGYSCSVEIKYDKAGKCEVVLWSKVVHTFYGVRSISKIDVLAGPAAHVKLDDFQILRQTVFGKVKPYITAGDKKYNDKDYMGAAMEYGKAIDGGYKVFDIYYKRASAYYCAEFYNNAIEDYTKALQYRSSEDAYFFRGMSKIAKNDISGIDDLLKGGSRGQALAKEFEVDEPTSPRTDVQQSKYIASGTGFFLDPRGFIATNFHVIDGANNIDVFVTKDGKTSIYSAKSVVVDKSNDLAIVKITDSEYVKMPQIPYTVASGTKDVGTEVYAMGYPELSYLGEELKVTDGIISSKTGYQGDITTYQISAAIQPGNSGGPLFDNKGYLVGITNAGVPGLQNVGYAIKVSYLNNLIDACPEVIYMPTKHQLAGLPLTDRVKKSSPYVVIIKVY